MSRMADAATMPTAPATVITAKAAAGSAMGMGALACLAYAMLNVLVNGVVLDELILPGQIIAQLVSYPTGHPHELFSREAFSLLDYLAAALLLVLRDATLVSGLLNVLFLFCSTFAPFALTFALTRSPLWATAAACLTAAEVALRLKGIYPLFVFPAYFTNGHVGTYLAVVVIAMFLARQWRIGALLLGVLPAVHAAMAMLVWPWAALYLAFSVRPDAPTRSTLLRGFAYGFAVCLALAAVVKLQSMLTNVAAPYDVAPDGGVVYQSFSQHTDAHRRLFRPESFGYLVNPVAFLCLAALPLWLQRRRTNVAAACTGHQWLLVFGVALWGYVYFAWLVANDGGSLPRILHILMPFRYSNLTAIMLVPLTASALAQAYAALAVRQRAAAALLLAGLLACAAVAFLVDSRLVERNLLAVLWATYFCFELFADGASYRRRTVVLACFALVMATLLPFLEQTRVAVYSLAAFAAGCSVLLLAPRMVTLGLIPRAVRWAIPGAALLLAAAALPGRSLDPHPERAYMRISATDRAMTEWLRQHARPDELILPAMSPWTALQHKTGQPVLFHWETLYLMTYMPELAPVIGAMAFDLYGVRYGDEQTLSRACGGRINQWCPVWLETWPTRSPQQWQALSRKYGFNLVLAPENTSLRLPIAWRGPLNTLYRIP